MLFYWLVSYVGRHLDYINSYSLLIKLIIPLMFTIFELYNIAALFIHCHKMKCPASLYRSAVLPKIKHYRRDITFHINASFSLKCKIFREYMVYKAQEKNSLIKKCLPDWKRGAGVLTINSSYWKPQCYKHAVFTLTIVFLLLG